MTGEPAPENGYVLCVGMPLRQVNEVARLLRGRAAVIATVDTDGARALLGPQEGGRSPVAPPPPRGRHRAPEAGGFDDGPGDRVGDRFGDGGASAEPAPPAWPQVPPSYPSTGMLPVVAPPTGAVPVAPTGAVPAVSPATTSPQGTAATGVAPSAAYGGEAVSSTLLCGPVEVDLAAREVRSRGSRIHLSMREFDLLAALASDVHRVWSFAELTRHVWGNGYFGDTDPVASAVKRLRKRLRSVPELEVSSVRGVGYRLRVPA